MANSTRERSERGVLNGAFVHAVLVGAGSLALLVATAGGCGEDSAPEAPATQELKPTGGQSTSTTTNPAPAGTAVAAAGASPCEDFGNISGQALQANTEQGSESFLLPLVDRPVPSRLGVIAVGSAADLVGPSVALGAGANDNYASCTHCLAIALDCPGSDCTSGTWFFARSGTAQFTAVGDHFAGKFNDAVLQQVTIDWSSLKSTPVAGGACISIPQLTFAATVELNTIPVPDGGGVTLDAGSEDAGSSSGSTSSSSSSSSSASSSGTSGTSGGGDSFKRGLFSS